MEFMPGFAYSLNECLKGNYVMTALPSKSTRPRIVVTYFTQRGDVYQQVLFAYHPKQHNLIASTVEKDNNLDGTLDMMLICDTNTGNLQLLGKPKQDYNIIGYLNASLLDKYFSDREEFKKQD